MAQIKLSKEEIEFILMQQVGLIYNSNVTKIYAEDYLTIPAIIFEVE